MARPLNFNDQGVVRDIMTLLPAAKAPEPTVDIKAWPIMESKATHGIIGRIVNAAIPIGEQAENLQWAALKRRGPRLCRAR
jgi:hypothetical protein